MKNGTVNRRLLAAFTIAIFALSSVAVATPVSAHTTLGDYASTFPFYCNESDTHPSANSPTCPSGVPGAPSPPTGHVPGPLGYVFPGSGQGPLTGPFGSPPGYSSLSATAHEYPLYPPGYQVPNPSSYPPGQQANTYQLQGDTYSPFGAILASTYSTILSGPSATITVRGRQNIGPLIFAFNFTDPCSISFRSGSYSRTNSNPHNNDNFLCTGPKFPDNVDPKGPMLNFTGISVYIPPEFDLSSASGNPDLIQTSFAGNLKDISLTKSDPQDPLGPGWWLLDIEGNIQFWPQHLYQEWYYIRINGVGAPRTAGKYFFKMFLWDSAVPEINVPGAFDTLSSTVPPFNPSGVSAFIPSSDPTTATFPVANWPVVLVKGEIDPGIVTGTIRYGTFNTTLYSNPINEAGRVFLNGTANDPYTGLPIQRRVTAVGYFNASAAGHYEVEGVAPGVYTVYAQAAGFPTQVIATGVTIFPGQALHLDGYINPGAVVHGQVNSKHLFGTQPWPSDPRPIMIELYSKNDYSGNSLVAWSPWNKTHAGYMAYDWPQGADFPKPLPVSFPWASYPAAQAKVTSYYSATLAVPAAPLDHLGEPIYSPIAGGTYKCGASSTSGSSAAKDYIDRCGKPDGAGPAQFWWVDSAGSFTNGGGPSSFNFQFGVKGVFGAPTAYDGHVPQPYATWINGLNAGRYWMRVWVNGYVQTLQDGVTFDPYYFDVAPQEWAGDIYMPMDIRVSSMMNLTVHLHDQPNTLTDCPIEGCIDNTAEGFSTGPRYLIAEVRDSNGKLAGFNFTLAPSDKTKTVGGLNPVNPANRLQAAKNPNPSSIMIEVNGLGMMGPDPNNLIASTTTSSIPSCPPFPSTSTPSTCRGMKFSLYRYAAGQSVSGSVYDCSTAPLCRDYGLLSGTYTVRIYMRGYIQTSFPSVSLTLSGSPAMISTHLYRGARFNVTIFSIDWEHPSVPKTWNFPGSNFYVDFVNAQTGVDYGHVYNQTSLAFKQELRQPSIRSGVVMITGSCSLKATDIPNICRIIEYDGNTKAEIEFADAFGIKGFWPFDHIYNSDGFLVFTSYYIGSQLAAMDALPAGSYNVYGYTYGYIQNRNYALASALGGFGVAQLQLLQGVNVTLNIPFKMEGVYTATAYNMTMRVRVFDDKGRMVASVQSQDPDVFRDGIAVGPTATIPTTLPTTEAYDHTALNGIGRLRQADVISGGHAYEDWGGSEYTYYVDPYGRSPSRNPANTVTSVNPSTTADTFLWYGVYGNPTGKANWYAFDSDFSHDGVPDFSWHNVQYGGWTTFIPAGTQQVRVMIAGVYDINDPLGPQHTATLQAVTLASLNGGLTYGIPGYSSTILNSYTGQYIVEVDTWNQYPTPTFTNLLPSGANWMPAVQGLLQGDSYHTIPGAKPNTFGYTGTSSAANQLGPYAQQQPWILPNAHLSAEASAVYELDKRGYVSGNVYGFAIGNTLRTQSWATLTAAAAAGKLTWPTYVTDSYYAMYVDPGTYKLAVALWTPSGNEGLTTISSSLTITPGQTTSGGQFQLEQSKIAIPEFNGLALVAFTALGASLYILQRRRKHS